jgi:hypothetical protein
MYVGLCLESVGCSVDRRRWMYCDRGIDRKCYPMFERCPFDSIGAVRSKISQLVVSARFVGMEVAEIQFTSPAAGL